MNASTTFEKKTKELEAVVNKQTEKIREMEETVKNLNEKLLSIETSIAVDDTLSHELKELKNKVELMETESLIVKQCTEEFTENMEILAPIISDIQDIELEEENGDIHIQTNYI